MSSGSVCAEQHKFHHSHHLISSKKFMRDIDVPPKNLLNRRTLQDFSNMYSDSPRFSSVEETILRKFLLSNNGFESDDDADHPYSSDRFRMYEFKIRRCTRNRSHDWTDCPFAHPGEKACRRDPTFYRYSGMVCPEYRLGGCSRGDTCEFAHGVFETWLHPSRYRTEACKDGKNCKRKVCFFAHTPRQLRIVSDDFHSPWTEMACKKNQINCCLYCHCGGAAASASPTSTLLGLSHLSPPLSPSQSSTSPPLSPMEGRNRSGISLSPMSVYSETFGGFYPISQSSPRQAMTSETDALTELMSSMVAMKISEALPVSTVPAANSSPSLPWIDVSFNSDDQQQFILSPCTPSSSSSRSANSFNGNYFGGKFDGSCNKMNKLENGSSSSSSSGACRTPTPDIEWVNDLLV